MQPKQPKIVQKLLIRTFILLMSVAAVFLAIQFILNWRKDPDSGTADTAGMVAALEIRPEGQQAVIFDSSGKKIASPEYAEGKTDRDIAWLPDGNRLYFSSDRKEAAYNLYRWNPATGSVTQKSTGSISRFDPSFEPVPPGDMQAAKSASKTALITQGGFVLEFDLFEQSTQQLLPPPGGVTAGNEEGSGGSGQFDALYQKFGNSFRTARWLGNRDYIAAVMKKDEGEVLIVQKMGGGKPEELIPRAIMAGERIDIDVDSKSGKLVFTVLAFQFPDRDRIPEQFIKNGKVVKPYQNGVFVLDPSASAQESLIAIAISGNVENAFGPALAKPDGSQIAVTTGRYDGTNFIPASLMLMPMQAMSMNSGTELVRGEIREITWSPSGNQLAYVKREGKERAIYTIASDGSSETKLSDGGSYMTPKFSPQTK